ncbi:PepSY-associated TM helix domain-containing protein [Gilvimarinus polysaccharolyticus]|uniref:PepSY-associated TM helix domain-containing protein n=1 Tax=Gilvimarinus polysaccharolyticus TaxID=863921 RepID=UPI000673479E|nr:PepSY-associated TM helix domain-containing protein [Gilvimarinus polysaccharolyticus]
MQLGRKFGVFKLLRLLHRYVGLAIALFIILAALTGSLLAFMPELEKLTAPRLYSSEATSPRLSFADYASAAENIDSRVLVRSVSFAEQGRVIVGVMAKNNPATGELFLLGFSQMLLDPTDGTLLGVRTHGSLSEGWHNIMPFIYQLHYSLILGAPGWWLMGIVAVIWTIDCFTGLLITLPLRAKRRTPRRSFMSRWAKAWKIKTGSSFARFNFDLHRALSLWLWLVLLVFAWSSVYMNLWGSFYLHATRQVMEFHPPWYHLADREPSDRQPPISWQAAQTYADDAMQALAQREQIEIIQPNALAYVRSYGAYRYRAQSSRDLSAKHVRTEVYVDAVTGEPIFHYLPTGQYAGNTVSSWLHVLHRARIWGVWYQIFVSLLGVFLVVISVSGVLVWWKKRA